MTRKLLSFVEARDKEKRTIIDNDYFLYIVEGTREEFSCQISFCFDMKVNLMTSDEAMKSHDSLF